MLNGCESLILGHCSFTQQILQLLCGWLIADTCGFSPRTLYCTPILSAKDPMGMYCKHGYQNQPPDISVTILCKI